MRSKQTNTTGGTRRRSTLRSAVTNARNIVAARLAKFKESINNDEERCKKKRILGKAVQEILVLRAANGGIKKHGDISQVIEKYQSVGYDFVTRGSVCHRLSIGCNRSTSDVVGTDNRSTDNIIPVDRSTITVHNDTDTLSDLSSSANNKGGRKSGTTDAAKMQYSIDLQNALTKASLMFAEERVTAKDKGENVRHGCLQDIARQVENEFNLPEGSVVKKTVVSRVDRNNLTGTAPQRTSPLASIEPFVVETCIRLANMGAALTKDQVLALVNSFIEGTEMRNDFINFKAKRKLYCNQSDTAVVGEGWYQGFMRRNSNKIIRKQGRIKDIKRHTWCVYERFESMYDSVYSQMVKSNVAKELENEVLLDRNGNVVEEQSNALGLPTKYVVTDPNYILFVDETGKNTNMKSDGMVGGQRFIIPRDAVTNTGCLGSTTDLHFTVLCFTAGTGEPVMCAVIFKSEQDVSKIPMSWKMGINIKNNLRAGGNNAEMFALNEGEGNAMEGGPKCYFNGIVIPTFIGTSPKASITSTMLADMLRMLDTLNIFDRSTGKLPFLLLDGHHSRIEKPFLDYICDDAHKWTVCIGVPYGTHIWQVADAEEMNGSFSSAVTKAKKELFNAKPIGSKHFSPSDIIPLINAAWPKSFGNINFARKAISDRGWGPLNYNLLKHPDIESTRYKESNAQTIDSTSTSRSTNQSISDLTAINTTTGSAGDALSAFILEEMKNKGRLEVLKRQKLESENLNSNIKKLQGITKISSGILASANHHHLDEDVRDAVCRSLHAKEQEENDKQAKKAQRQQESSNKYKQATNKYNNSNRQTSSLNTTELLTILKHHVHPGDSPIAKTVVDRRRQLERRKYRISPLIYESDGKSDPNEAKTRPDLETTEITNCVGDGMFRTGSIFMDHLENNNINDCVHLSTLTTGETIPTGTCTCGIGTCTCDDAQNNFNAVFALCANDVDISILID